MLAAVVYVLCALTSLACAYLLAARLPAERRAPAAVERPVLRRAQPEQRPPLRRPILWPDTDLYFLHVPALIGLVLLLYGLMGNGLNGLLSGAVSMAYFVAGLLFCASGSARTTPCSSTLRRPFDFGGQRLL